VSDDRLTEAVLRLAAELPAASVEQAARTIAGTLGPEGGERVIGAVPQANYRRLATGLVEAWRKHPQVRPDELAAMLRTAAAARAAARAEGRVEVVWTGPETPQVPSRLTEAVVEEVVEAARHQLLLVTYAAFPYPPLATALRRAAARGVSSRVLVETRAGAGRLLEIEPAQAFVGIPGVTLYEWPPQQRRNSSGGGRGHMHAKLIVADRQLAFVTSANLTGSAIEDNLECGLLVRGGPVPGQLADHVDALIRQGVFRPLTLGGSGGGG